MLTERESDGEARAIMSKKSNMKRTQRRRKAKAYNEAKATARREDALQQQQAARKAYREMQSVRRKKVFTTGAKAVLASVAIMLMFVAGLVSWSVVKNIRQRRDDQTQQSSGDSQMVSSGMVTGMTRSATRSISRSPRFLGFAETSGGYDGKTMFGGRVSAYGVDGVLSERENLERLWQEAADAREKSSDDNIADRAKADKAASSDANKSRYQTVTTEDGSLAVKTTDDESEGGDDAETGATDEQIRKLIESSEASTSR